MSYTRMISLPALFFFFFNATATTEIYTLSLHDALPISVLVREEGGVADAVEADVGPATEQPLRVVQRVGLEADVPDRKSTRLNSSHANISYAVFCLKKKTEMIHDDENLHALVTFHVRGE